MHRKEMAQLSYCLRNCSNNYISAFKIRKKELEEVANSFTFPLPLDGMTFKEKKGNLEGNTAEI